MVGEDKVTIRQATVTDIPDLVRLRRAMFEAMGFDDLAQLDAADEAAAAYFAESIPTSGFYGWLAVASASGEAVGSGGVVIDRHPPGPNNLSGWIGYIMNLVTLPRYQKQGIGRRMMQAMIEWLADQGIHRITLHATEMGRPLYADLGFVDGNEMQLRLE